MILLDHIKVLQTGAGAPYQYVIVDGGCLDIKISTGRSGGEGGGDHLTELVEGLDLTHRLFGDLDRERLLKGDDEIDRVEAVELNVFVEVGFLAKQFRFDLKLFGEDRVDLGDNVLLAHHLSFIARVSSDLRLSEQAFDDEGGVGPTKAKRVAQEGLYLGLSCLRDDVKVLCVFIRFNEVDIGGEEVVSCHKA